MDLTLWSITLILMLMALTLATRASRATTLVMSAQWSLGWPSRWRAIPASLQPAPERMGGQPSSPEGDSQEEPGRVAPRRAAPRPSKRGLGEHGERVEQTTQVLMQVISAGPAELTQHVRQVAWWVDQLARQLGRNPKARRQLSRAALMSWIGCPQAPTSLFGKTLRRFDAEERAIWEFHGLLSAQLLQSVEGFQVEAQLVALYGLPYDHGRVMDVAQSLWLGQDQEPSASVVEAANLLHLCDGFVRELAARGGHARELMRALNQVSLDVGRAYRMEHVEALLSVVERQGHRAGLRELASIQDLEPGMVLAYELSSPQGCALAAAQQRVTLDLIDRLRFFQETAQTSLGSAWIWAWSDPASRA